jgi:hypothetical protein
MRENYTIHTRICVAQINCGFTPIFLSGVLLDKYGCNQWSWLLHWTVFCVFEGIVIENSIFDEKLHTVQGVA